MNVSYTNYGFYNGPGKAIYRGNIKMYFRGQDFIAVIFFL